MLVIMGKALDVSDREVRPASGASFYVTEVSVLTGKTKVERIELAKDFRGSLPLEGDEVALQVSIKTFSMKGDRVGYSLTAWENVSESVVLMSHAG